MKTIAKRAKRPRLSRTGEHVLAQYEPRFRTEEDLTAATIRNDESDLRHRFGYRMASSVPLHRLAQLMGHDSLAAAIRSVQATTTELQQEVERMT